MAHTQQTINLKAVKECIFFYRNQDGDTSKHKPLFNTVHSIDIDHNTTVVPLMEYPHETAIERARRLDILDKWVAICILKFTKYHTVEYKGTKATTMHQAYRKLIYDN